MNQCAFVASRVWDGCTHKLHEMPPHPTTSVQANVSRSVATKVASQAQLPHGGDGFHVYRPVNSLIGVPSWLASAALRFMKPAPTPTAARALDG